MPNAEEFAMLARDALDEMEASPPKEEVQPLATWLADLTRKVEYAYECRNSD